MKKIFLTADGTARAETIRLNTRFIQESDGYHTATPETVTHDEQHRAEPLIFLLQGQIAPVGSLHSETNTRSMLREIELIRMGHARQSVSRIWMRSLERFMGIMAKFMAPILIFGVILYAILGGQA